MGEGWRLVRLGEIAEESRERFDPSNGEERHYIGLEHLESNTGQITAVGSSRDVTSAKTVFRAGDTLFGKLRPYLRKVAQPNFDGVCSTDILAIRPRPGTIPEYLSALLASEPVIQAAVSSAAGTKMPRTSWRQLSQVIVPHPPLHEQHRIAEIIGSVDEATQATRAVVEQTRKVKQGMLQELLTRGIGHTRFKQTEIGEVPEGWEVRRLGDLIPKDAIRNGLYKPSSDYGEGAPIIRIDAFQNGDTIGAAGLKRVQVTPGELAAYGVQKGDVLINRVNSLSHLGKVGIVGELHRPTVFESNMMCIRLPNTSGLLREYLLYLLASERGRSLVYGSAKHAVAQASINQQDIRSFTFALPPVAEQERFINIVAAENKAAVEQKRWLDLLHSVRSGLIRTYPKSRCNSFL